MASPDGGGGGGGLGGVSFCWVFVPLASQNPYPITVLSAVNYRPHLSYFWLSVIFVIPM